MLATGAFRCKVCHSVICEPKFLPWGFRSIHIDMGLLSGGFCPEGAFVQVLMPVSQFEEWIRQCAHLPVTYQI